MMRKYWFHLMTCFTIAASQLGEESYPGNLSGATEWVRYRGRRGLRLNVRRVDLFSKGRKNLVLALILVYKTFALPVAVLAEGPASQDPHIPLRLVIPTIALETAIETVGSKVVEVNGQRYRQWNTADNLVGWHNRSALLGKRGNTVLAGHSNINSMVFRNLNRVQPGDEVIVFSSEHAYRYIVTDILELQEKGMPVEQRAKNGRMIARTDDERLTLVTCSRPGATHRIVVIAHPAAKVAVSTSSPAGTRQSDASSTPSQQLNTSLDCIFASLATLNRHSDQGSYRRIALSPSKNRQVVCLTRSFRKSCADNYPQLRARLAE